MSKLDDETPGTIRPALPYDGILPIPRLADHDRSIADAPLVRGRDPTLESVPLPAVHETLEVRRVL
ncbi:MAG: hypothetical protein LC808_14930, partial [Actinobacteria bacterium]|nr:hypothetical protein [Actinomycetota bacterium]